MTNHAPNLTDAGIGTDILHRGDSRALKLDLPAPAGSHSSDRLKRCFSFPVFLGAILVATNFAIVRGLRLDPDTWWHLKYGETILQTRQFPTVDTWSFTVHGMPRVAYEWGGEGLIALAYRPGGRRGMGVLVITLCSIIVRLTYYIAC